MGASKPVIKVLDNILYIMCPNCMKWNSFVVESDCDEDNINVFSIQDNGKRFSFDGKDKMCCVDKTECDTRRKELIDEKNIPCDWYDYYFFIRNNVEVKNADN